VTPAESEVLWPSHQRGLYTNSTVVAYLHSLLAAGVNDSLCKTLHVRVLNAEVKYSSFPVFKIVRWLFDVLKLKYLDANSISGG